MADLILKQLSNDQDFGREIAPGYEEIKHTNINTQAKMTLGLYVDRELYRKAFEIVGETVYDFHSENRGLREELQQYGEIDEEKIRRLVQTKSKNDSNEIKNKIILECFRKTLAKSKAINY